MEVSLTERLQTEQVGFYSQGERLSGALVNGELLRVDIKSGGILGQPA